MNDKTPIQRAEAKYGHLWNKWKAIKHEIKSTNQQFKDSIKNTSLHQLIFSPQNDVNMKKLDLFVDIRNYLISSSLQLSMQTENILETYIKWTQQLCELYK